MADAGGAVPENLRFGASCPVGENNFHIAKMEHLMTRPRTPKAMAAITGADTQHPGRYAARSEPKGQQLLGASPGGLTPGQRAACRQLADELPWLAKSDRAMLTLAARLEDRVDNDPACSLAAFTQLRLCLSSLGATPVDRSKVNAAADDDDDPAAFFQ